MELPLGTKGASGGGVRKDAVRVTEGTYSTDYIYLHGNSFYC